MNSTDINGRAIAAKMLTALAQEVTELRDAGWSPKLVSVQVGENPAADLYVRNQKRKAEGATVTAAHRLRAQYENQFQSHL